MPRSFGVLCDEDVLEDVAAVPSDWRHVDAEVQEGATRAAEGGTGTGEDEEDGQDEASLQETRREGAEGAQEARVGLLAALAQLL